MLINPRLILLLLLFFFAFHPYILHVIIINNRFYSILNYISTRPDSFIIYDYLFYTSDREFICQEVFGIQ